MAWTVITDDTLDFNQPLASQTMRALRDNVTRVDEGTQMTVTVPRVSNSFGVTYCRTTISSVIPTGGTLLAGKIVSATPLGGTLLSLRATPNDADGININAVVTGDNSSVTVVIEPVFGRFGGLTT